MKKILVLEDEANIRSFVVINLRRSGFEPIEAENGEMALEKLKVNPDICMALLDVMLPDIDGFEVCRRIRATGSKIGIIMLTAKSQEIDKVTGLMTGADDYVTVECNPLELFARIKAQIRRYFQLIGLCEDMSRIYKVEGLTIDDVQRTVTADGRNVRLTPIEYKILKLLVQRKGEVLSNRQIYETIWRMQPIGADNIIAVHIRHIREKIESNPRKPKYLKAVWGNGYKVG